jgi:hypothetical protein
MSQLGDKVQPRLCHRLKAGIVPQCAVVDEIDEAQIHPHQFQRGTDAALQLGLKRRQLHILPVLVGAALGPAPLAVFLLDGFRRTFLDLFAHQLLCDQRVGRAGFNLCQ